MVHFIEELSGNLDEPLYFIIGAVSIDFFHEEFFALLWKELANGSDREVDFDKLIFEEYFNAASVLMEEFNSLIIIGLFLWIEERFNDGIAKLL